MASKEKNVFLTNLPVKLVCGAVALLFITVKLQDGYSLALSALWIFAVGAGLAYALLSNYPLVPTILVWTRRDQEALKQLLAEEEKRRKSTGCPVCGDALCSRHSKEATQLHFQPWEEVRIPQEVDKALTEFFELVMENYVHFWYKELSQDEYTLQLIRYAFRHAVAVTVTRLAKIDIPTLISGKLLQAAAHHIDVYVRAKQSLAAGASMEEIERAVLKAYGHRLHRALRGGAYSERQYNCHLANFMLPHLLPPDAKNSRALHMMLREIIGAQLLKLAMESITDPDWVNNLIIILLAPAVPLQEPKEPRIFVPILESFVKPLSSRSLLHVSLGEIMDTPTLLLPFMNFLKSIGQVHLLQFCLETREFQSEGESADRHGSGFLDQVQRIYRAYLAKDAPDLLNWMDKDIVSDFDRACRAVEDGDLKRGLSVLIETMPITRAFSKAYGITERDYVPLFFQTNEFLEAICGPAKIRVARTRSVNPSIRSEPLKHLSKLGRRLRRKMRGSLTADDSAMLAPGSDFDEEFLNIEKEGLFVSKSADEASISDQGSIEKGLEEESPEVMALAVAAVEDFSLWTVTVDGLEQRFLGNKPFFVYRIKSKEPGDSEGSQRVIGRRFSEFFGLHKKLRQFHGDDLGVALPVKRLITLGRFTPRQHLERNERAMESYLQQLLALSDLKRSQLLYNFLANPDVTFMGKAGVTGAIDRMKAVPRKIKTEVLGKGQHLETFLSTFLASTESNPPEHSPEALEKIHKEMRDVEEARESFVKMANYEVPSEDRHWEQAVPDSEEHRLEGLIDYIVFAAQHLFRAPRWLLWILVSAKVIGHRTLDTFLDTFLLGKVDIVKSDFNVIELIALFRDTVFFDEDPPRTDEMKEERRRQVLYDLETFIPGPIHKLIGQEKFHDGCSTIIEIVQHPTLNKQLGYTLFDIVVEEIFPESSIKVV